MKPEAIIAALDGAASIDHTPCGSGTMPWRRWGDRGPLLVLLHGGAGSWLHWVANIETLAPHFRLLVPDLPGLGAAAPVPEPQQPATVAALVASGLRSLIGAESFHVAAFSWGCTIAGGLGVHFPRQLQSLYLTGPAALGNVPMGDITPLRRREAAMTPVQLRELQRDNLRLLMLHRDARIDALAISCQQRNSSRSRFNSPQFARTDVLYRWLAQSRCPLTVIYGAEDRTARPDFAARRSHLFAIRPDLRFATAAGAGHWLQYERPQLWAGMLQHHLALAATARPPRRVQAGDAFVQRKKV